MKQWKKCVFVRSQRETMGKEDEICFTMHFVCLKSKSFLDISIFFLFGINIGVVIPKEKFGKDKLDGGIKFIFRNQIWKNWLICEFFCSMWKRGHVTDFKDMLQTQDWANSAKRRPAIQFCPWDFRTCPCPEDMSGTCPGYFQLSPLLWTWQMLLLCWRVWMSQENYKIPGEPFDPLPKIR